jgi:hypothetical protein
LTVLFSGSRNFASINKKWSLRRHIQSRRDERFLAFGIVGIENPEGVA